MVYDIRTLDETVFWLYSRGLRTQIRGCFQNQAMEFQMESDMSCKPLPVNELVVNWKWLISRVVCVQECQNA